MTFEELKNAERLATYAARYAGKNTREHTMGMVILGLLSYISEMQLEEYGKALQEYEFPESLKLLLV